MTELSVIEMPSADPLKLSWLELSDLGNAERLIARAAGKLLHVEGRGWLAFDGKRWSAEQGEQLAHRQAHDVARAMRDEARALAQAIKDRKLPDGLPETVAQKRLEDLRKWSVTSGNANKTAAMLAQAAQLISAFRDDFDADPLAINCLSGTLRVGQDSGGKWRVVKQPHDPADMISRAIEVDYDPKATCPNWEQHLKTVLPDPEVRRFFRSIIGYALTGLTTEQCIFLLQGRGGDGKSTTMNVIRTILGLYGSAADVQTFMAGAMRSGADASPDLARLSGDMRLCSTGEPRRGGALDEAKIKAITGGSPIAARELHGDLFEYVPRFKLFLECNAKPRISGDDDGIWRRIIVIMFPHQFDRAHADKRIQERLVAEGPGILNWAIAGMLEWLEAGQLEPPQAVLDAVEDYRRAANPFGEWFHERLDTRDSRSETSSADLYADYKDWCERNDVGDRDVMTSTAFGRALGDRQILKKKDPRGRIVRKGARLRPLEGSAPLAERAAPAAAPGVPEQRGGASFDEDDEA